MNFLNKTIEYGLYLLVFLLPWQTRWIIKAGELNGGYWEYGTYGVYGTDILLIILLALYIIVIASDRRERSNLTDSELNQRLLPPQMRGRNDNLAWWFIGGLIITSAISVFFAINKALALYKFGWLVLGVGLFWLISSAKFNRFKLIWSLLFGLAAQAALAVWQFLSQSALANKWLGLAAHSAAELGTSVIETVGADGMGERWLRAYGGLDHPNILGGMLAVGILLIIYLSLIDAPAEKSPALRATTLIKGLIILFSAALFFSFSRSAWLGLAAGLAAWLAGAVVKKNFWAQKNILQTILISGAVFFILFGQYPNLVMTRLYAEERLEIKSKSERLESIKNTRPIIKNNLLTGVGLGNYTLALGRQRPGQESYFYQPAHNVFLLVWSETGIMGVLFFVGLIVYSLILNFKFKILNYGEEKIENNRIVNIAILIALIIIMSLDHWLWSLHFGVLFLFLTLGLMVEKRKILDSPPAFASAKGRGNDNAGCG